MDWTTGRSDELARRAAKNPDTASERGEHAGHMGGKRGRSAAVSYAAIDKREATVAPLNLAYPVPISPPTKKGGNWTARSDAGKRTLRVNLDLDPNTAAVVKRVNPDQRQWIDRAVGIGVAAHEGQVFPLNQIFNVVTAVGLDILNVSAVMMWWQRRPQGVLGAPVALPNRRISKCWLAPALVLSVYTPLLGVSIIVVLVTEFFVLRRIPAASRWLGLAASGASA